jgi:hypothetical protein
MSSKEAQFQPNVGEECVQTRDRGFRLGGRRFAGDFGRRPDKTERRL